MNDPDKIARLGDAFLATIEEFSHDNPGLTTGEVMGALFAMFISVAQGSEEYSPKKLIADTDYMIREAIRRTTS